MQIAQHALERLNVSDTIVLGHSRGASVAVALALKYPDLVRGLVLASGFYYPTARPDVIAMGAPAAVERLERMFQPPRVHSGIRPAIQGP